MQFYYLSFVIDVQKYKYLFHGRYILTPIAKLDSMRSSKLLYIACLYLRLYILYIIQNSIIFRRLLQPHITMLHAKSMHHLHHHHQEVRWIHRNKILRTSKSSHNLQTCKQYLFLVTTPSGDTSRLLIIQLMQEGKWMRKKCGCYNYFALEDMKNKF